MALRGNLVTDVHRRWAIAGLRALGRAGLDLLAVAPWSAPAESRGALRSSAVVDSRRHLIELTSSLPDDEGFLLQEHVQGTLISLEVVIDREGRLVRRFQQVVVRTSPPEGGSVARSVSVAPDEALAAQAADMLARVGYWGLAGLQFLSNGMGLALIDVNPRFYGPLPLSLACGMNLPAAWHAVTVGEDPGRPDAYPAGITYHRAEADIGAALRGRPDLLFGGGSRPRAGSFWAPDDPVPAALLTAEAVGVRIAKRVGQLRRRLGR